MLIHSVSLKRHSSYFINRLDNIMTCAHETFIRLSELGYDIPKGIVEIHFEFYDEPTKNAVELHKMENNEYWAKYNDGHLDYLYFRLNDLNQFGGKDIYHMRILYNEKV